MTTGVRGGGRVPAGAGTPRQPVRRRSAAAADRATTRPIDEPDANPEAQVTKRVADDAPHGDQHQHAQPDPNLLNGILSGINPDAPKSTHNTLKTAVQLAQLATSVPETVKAGLNAVAAEAGKQLLQSAASTVLPALARKATAAVQSIRARGAMQAPSSPANSGVQKGIEKLASLGRPGVPLSGPIDLSNIGDRIARLKDHAAAAMVEHAATISTKPAQPATLSPAAELVTPQKKLLGKRRREDIAGPTSFTQEYIAQLPEREKRQYYLQQGLKKVRDALPGRIVGAAMGPLRAALLTR